MCCGPVREDDPGSIAGPTAVLVIGKHSHAPIPVPPKDFDDAIAAGVVPLGGGHRGLSDLLQSGHELRHEFGGLVAMENVGGAMLENNGIEECGDERGDLPIRKR